MTCARRAQRSLRRRGAAELDAKLGVFPFDQKEALARAAKFKAAGMIDKLAMQRAWAAEFREEYRQLREEALK